MTIKERLQRKASSISVLDSEMRALLLDAIDEIERLEMKNFVTKNRMVSVKHDLIEIERLASVNLELI